MVRSKPRIWEPLDAPPAWTWYTVSAGAVVAKSLPPQSVVLSAPAKVLNTTPSVEQELADPANTPNHNPVHSLPLFQPPLTSLVNDDLGSGFCMHPRVDEGCHNDRSQCRRIAGIVLAKDVGMTASSTALVK